MRLGRHGFYGRLVICRVRADVLALSDPDPGSTGTQSLVVAARVTTLQKNSGKVSQVETSGAFQASTKHLHTLQ